MLKEHLCFRTFVTKSASFPTLSLIHIFPLFIPLSVSWLVEIRLILSELIITSHSKWRLWHWSLSDGPSITPSHPGCEADSQRAAVSQEAEMFGKELVKFSWPPDPCSRRSLPAAPFWSLCAKVCFPPSQMSPGFLLHRVAWECSQIQSVNDMSSDCSTSLGLFRLPGSLNCKRILLSCKYQRWPSLV